MTGYLIYTIPFFSGAIGWITNYFAIKMLFRPRIAKNILGVKIQGVFPKRQHELGIRLGNVVAKELFSVQMIKEKIDNESVRGQLKEAIMIEMENYLREYRDGNKMMAMFLNEKTIASIKLKLGEKLETTIPKMIEKFTGKMEDDIDIAEIVADRIHNFSHDRLENLLMSIIDKELKLIELLGAVLGFLVGLLQLGFVFLTQQYQ
ncbi:MAG: uncharacterized membrane protein YheB (UPF0754 family) [Flammeovirgaceae bacterium]|jgi:uncharacterized membrane protein YheB (UPF0754 family)